MSKPNRIRSSGVTLIELIISIVIISIAITGIMMLFAGTTKTSADPMVRAQALAIAQSYMDEIIMQPWFNDGATIGRSHYNEIDDYNGITSGSAVEDQYGNPISSLAPYSVEVNVSVCSTSSCGSQLSTVQAKKITVTVSHSKLGINVPLTAYRAKY